MAQRIDVHHHYLPEAYYKAYHDQGLRDPSGWILPKWTLELDQSFMASQSISTSILSLTAPGTSVIHGPPANKLARDTNEYGHSLVSLHPQKYGFFATVPDLCDGLDPVFEELRYALDVLKADGVTLFTRYGSDNHYLGHPDFLPLWAELEKRKALVFIHPTSLADTSLVNPKLAQPFLDYPHESCRAAIDLIHQGVIRSHPNVKIILSHAGGTLPYLITRAALLLPDMDLSNGKSAEEIMEEARSFYFDLALSSNEYQLPLLRKFAKPGHILFGSDFPYAPTKTIGLYTRNLEEHEMSDEERFAIDRGNALTLFPRLAGK